MRAAISTFFAILAAIVTMVAVFAVKRAVAWGTQDWSGSAVWLATAGVVAVCLLMIAWTNLLRPMIDRRKQAKETSLREQSVRDSASD